MTTQFTLLPSAIIMLAFFTTTMARATIFSVTTTTDAGVQSLRASIEAANADASATPGAPHIISFKFGTSGPWVITLASALPALDNHITIEGPGADLLTVRRDPSLGLGTLFRIFKVNIGKSVVIDGLTISQGYIYDFGPAGYGGGINNEGGNLTVINSIVSDNGANNGGAGIATTGGTLNVTNSIIEDNGVDTYGGGISATSSATVTITNTTIRGNTTGGLYGGGLYAGSSTGTPTTVVILNSTFTDNRSFYGAAILNSDAIVTIINSTISGNSAGNFTDAVGGGITTSGGSMTIINSTITDNYGYIGGGIHAPATGAATLTIRNSIVAGNTASADALGHDIYGTVDSDGNNLIGKTNGSTGWISSDQQGTVAVPIDPLLGPLQDNGGPTLTHALLSGSPAIDEGSNDVLSSPYSLTSDQRVFFARLNGTRVDIGAVEFGTTDSRLPVELSGFTLSASNRSVRLAWRTASETDNAGFIVERAGERDTSFRAIASYLSHPQLVGLGTSNIGRTYNLTDTDLPPGGYRYRLIDVSTDGVRTVHPPKSIRIESAEMVAQESGALRLLPTTPNPADDETQVSFLLPEAMAVTLELYDGEGRRVAVVCEHREYGAGITTETISTRELAPGSYMLRLSAGGRMRMARLVVVR